MERTLFRAPNWTLPENHPYNLTDFLGPDWQGNLKEPGYLMEGVIVRPYSTHRWQLEEASKGSL